MRQTTLSVALEVKPESAAGLAALIDKLHDRGQAGLTPGQATFAWFLEGVPSVHFMSLSVFHAADYDPVFVVEANFDGPQNIFWAQLEGALGEELRGMLRCCKRPLSKLGPLYDHVAGPDGRAPVAPYFEAQALTPSVFHHGNRGMTRDRILQERALFLATRAEIATANAGDKSPYRGTGAADVHRILRAALVAQFPWLDEPAPTRFPFFERVGDYLKVVLFALAAVLALSLPGLILAPIMPDDRFFILLGTGIVLAGGWLASFSKALPGTSTHGKFNLIRALFSKTTLILAVIGTILYFAVAPIIATLAQLLTGVSRSVAWEHAPHITLLGLASLPFSLVLILAWVRYLEVHDTSQDAPPIDQETMRQMAQREDWIPQNHMGSIVLIKPGVLRTILIRAGHLGLGLVLRAQPASGIHGYLGSMRTVHFAHWAFVSNRSRLMFHSNFDQSWESYLDDFIEKAHEGLTLAWGSGVGFPPTRFLIEDGASHGRKFKAWARHSMAVSRFWFSAYSDLTVDQVERNYRIALGLRRKSLSEGDAAKWINDL